MCDLSVECPEELPPPHLSGSGQHFRAVVEVEVYLSCHLDLEGVGGGKERECEERREGAREDRVRRGREGRTG